MPIHLEDLDVVSGVQGSSSALIVPCNMCPAVTVAVNENRPFMRLFRSLLTSGPFEQYVAALRSRLEGMGVRADVFKSRLYHHWFVCMWGGRRREKLRKRAANYDAVVVLGCDTANETVRDAVEPAGCKVVEGMTVTGLMNAKMTFKAPCDITFEDCKIIPISH